MSVGGLELMSALPIDDSAKRVEELIAKVSDLAVLPHVVFKVLEISGSTESPASELERTIVIDPGFSTKLLTHANSAFYALPKRVTSIKEAICFLGFKAIRQMAMTVGLFDLFVGKNDRESLRRRTWWRHSLDSAICARWLATETRRVPPEEAYTCGLLHMIGKTLLDRFAQGGYDRVDNLTDQGYGELEAEMLVFGCTHIQVAIGAAHKWRLPDAIVSSLNYLEPADPGSDCAAYVACVALGSAIASSALHEHPVELPLWAMELLRFEQDRAEELIDRGTAAIASSGSMQL